MRTCINRIDLELMMKRAKDLLSALNIQFEPFIVSLSVKPEESVSAQTKQLSGELLCLSQFRPHTAARAGLESWSWYDLTPPTQTGLTKTLAP